MTESLPPSTEIPAVDRSINKVPFRSKKSVITILIVLAFLLYSLSLLYTGMALTKGVLVIPFKEVINGGRKTSLEELASTATIRGKIVAVKDLTLTVQNQAGIEEDFEMDREVYVVKMNSTTNKPGATKNPGDVEVGKDVTIIIKPVDSQLKVISVNYTDFPVDIR